MPPAAELPTQSVPRPMSLPATAVMTQRAPLYGSIPGELVNPRSRPGYGRAALSADGQKPPRRRRVGTVRLSPRQWMGQPALSRAPVAAKPVAGGQDDGIDVLEDAVGPDDPGRGEAFEHPSLRRPPRFQ
jgi:hypothetical protein